MFSSLKQGLFIALSAGAVLREDPKQGSLPVEFGVVLFPAFQALDVFGPLDALNMLSYKYPMNLHLISATLDPVSTKPRNASFNPFNSNVSESVVPTHTFTNPPEKLDVLIIPGGTGVLVPDTISSTVDFIKKTYPSLQYLITVCTGSHLAARAGVLDNRNATSNKAVWSWREGLGDNTNWISHARWVADGNIWSTSGVSAGIDGTFAWMEEVYGNDTATEVANSMEYIRHLNASYDPFADLYGL
ncbi:class I glutamine amidotransferase-like protein [Marasmius fiardii PR-910]|nr:class I glutamine amidotransferase-like protein [Marasmius fiardii PR-910]